MKKAKGYIFSRDFFGERIPQKVQNIVIRYFCNINNFEYQLSASEYKMKDCYLILENLISGFENYDYIVAYSLFQLPKNKIYREKILKKIIKKKKSIFFALEEIRISKISDIKKTNNLIKIKKNIND